MQCPGKDQAKLFFCWQLLGIFCNVCRSSSWHRRLCNCISFTNIAGNFTHYWPTAVTCSWRWQFEFGNIWCTNLALTDQTQGNRGCQNRLLKVLFFFGLCCARHNDSGSHEAMLKWSSVDNSIEQVGQQTTRKQRQNKQTAPTTNPNQQNLTNLWKWDC